MKVSIPGLRAVCAVAVFLAASSSVLAGFTARLWFKNETSGDEGPGAVSVLPGQEVSLNWSFHRDAGETMLKWAILEMFIDLASPDASAILTDNDANAWDARFGNEFPTDFFHAYVQWQPSDGPIHDNAMFPDDTTMPLITEKGVYFILGCYGFSPQAHDIDAPCMFTFHVGDAAIPGMELHWGLETRTTDNGIATQALDNKSKFFHATDNHILVIDGPVSHVSGNVMLGDTGGQPPSRLAGVLTRAGQQPQTVRIHPDADGHYTFPILADGYSLSIQRTHWLRKKIDIAATEGNVDAGTMQLVNGDAFQEGAQAGVINFHDLAYVLLNCWSDKPDPYADLDEDGHVGLLDIGIVLANFGLPADPP